MAKMRSFWMKFKVITPIKEAKDWRSFFLPNSFARCKVVDQSLQVCLSTSQPAAEEALGNLSAWIFLVHSHQLWTQYCGHAAVHWLVPWILPLAWSLRMMEESTFCGCLLLAAVANLHACAKMRSWFSVFTDCSDMISLCRDACITRECR